MYSTDYQRCQQFLATFTLIFLLGGCSLVMSGKDVDEHIKMMQAQNPMGCAYIKGNGTPPGSRVDGAVAGAWGEGMTAELMEQCLTKLKDLP